MAGLAASFGSGAMTNSIEEIERADCIFIIGSNTSIAHPLIATRIYRAKARGAKLIVADPRKIPIVFQSNLHLRQNLGTDVALINGLMHIILKNGWQDQTFIEERAENFEELQKVVEKYTPEKVSEITGIPVADLKKAAQWYAKAERSSILYTMGITQHTTGVDNVRSIANLAMLTGNIGKESTGVNPLRGQVVKTVLNSIGRYPFETSSDRMNPSLKSQIPSTNIQIISNNQYPNLFGDWNLVIEYYLGFVIWNL